MFLLQFFLFFLFFLFSDKVHPRLLWLNLRPPRPNPQPTSSTAYDMLFFLFFLVSLCHQIHFFMFLLEFFLFSSFLTKFTPGSYGSASALQGPTPHPLVVQPMIYSFSCFSLFHSASRYNFSCFCFSFSCFPCFSCFLIKSTSVQDLMDLLQFSQDHPTPVVQLR